MKAELLILDVHQPVVEAGHHMASCQRLEEVQHLPQLPAADGHLTGQLPQRLQSTLPSRGGEVHERSQQLLEAMAGKRAGANAPGAAVVELKHLERKRASLNQVSLIIILRSKPPPLLCKASPL